jgi:CheY-like chemotaxis protein
MALQSLLLSRDDAVIRVLRRVLSDMEIDVEVCTGPEKAAEELARRKWDAVIIDCDDVHGALDVLRSVRQTPSNKTSTAFAIINGVTSVRSAFELGANLALEKPITADRAKHSFRAVHGMMLQERRRYFRHPVDMAVTLKFEDKEKHHHHEVLATAVNLSEGCGQLHASRNPYLDRNQWHYRLGRQRRPSRHPLRKPTLCRQGTPGALVHRPCGRGKETRRRPAAGKTPLLAVKKHAPGFRRQASGSALLCHVYNRSSPCHGGR